MADINIVASSSVGVKPLTVSFTAEIVAGDYVSFAWDFGDGHTSFLQNPVHEYTTTGYHTVVLVAQRSDLSVLTVIERGIVVVGEIAFEASYDSVDEPPVTASFTNNSIAPTGYEFNDWHWSFGDTGIYSTATGPVHIYQEYGEYDVALSAKIVKMG